MAKFIPAEFVEKLEYDFTEYGGKTGEIREPSTGQVNTFFRRMKAMFKEVKALRQLAEDDDLKIEEMSDEQMTDIMDKVDEATDAASELQLRTIENLAELCGAKWEGEDDERKLVGGSPTYDELLELPYRVLQAFSRWLVGELQAKRETPGTKP